METDFTQTTKRINISLSCPVIDRLDRLARKVDCSRSQLVRGLITESLIEKEREEIELSMKQGYVANYDFIKKSNEDWDFTSGDGV